MRDQKPEGLVRLEAGEIAQVYENHMKRDFPESELKPLAAIMYMIDRGIYDCLGFFRDGEMRAYIFSVIDRERGFVLLDYLAVCEGGRGKGQGSLCIGHLQSFYREKKGLLLECESIESAENNEESDIRRRRIRFYEKNGCISTGVKALVFGVEYEILYLPLSQQQTDGALEMEHLYRTMLPDPVYEKRVRIWRDKK